MQQFIHYSQPSNKVGTTIMLHHMCRMRHGSTNKLNISSRITPQDLNPGNHAKGPDSHPPPPTADLQCRRPSRQPRAEPRVGAPPCPRPFVLPGMLGSLRKTESYSYGLWVIGTCVLFFFFPGPNFASLTLPTVLSVRSCGLPGKSVNNCTR